MKLGRIRGQMHGDQDLPGDGFALDERDQSQRNLPFLAYGLDAEYPKEKVRPPYVLGSTRMGWRLFTGPAGSAPAVAAASSLASKGSFSPTRADGIYPVSLTTWPASILAAAGAFLRAWMRSSHK